MPRTRPSRERGSRKNTNLVIDAHGHVRWYGYDAKRLVENMDQHGIDIMWLLTWDAPPEEMASLNFPTFWPGRIGMPLGDVLEAVDRYPDRLVPFYAPDPRVPNALDRLKAAVQNHGVRGVGELKCRIMLDDPGALEMFHYCGEAGLPVIFHMDVPLPRQQLGKNPGYWYCCDWDNLARALEVCPKTVFIGHAPGFWREISGDADSCAQSYPEGPVTPGGRLWAYLDEYANIRCDLSAGSALRALSRNPEIGREFLIRYQDRCLFARDGFDDHLHAFIKRSKLPETVYQKIMGQNALKLVPLRTRS